MKELSCFENIANFSQMIGKGKKGFRPRLQVA